MCIRDRGDLLSRLQSMINPEDIAGIMENPESLLEGIEMPEIGRAHV